MSVKIVTDSASDIPPQIAQELGITIVPLHILFGASNYRDGVDLTTDEFYHKLADSPSLPTTDAPTPRELAEAYNGLAVDTEEIISIHVSTRYSTAYGAAIQAQRLVKENCRVEVIDSKSAIMGEGLLTIEAAKASRRGETLEQITALVKDLIPRIHVRVVFDTLEYLRRGGAIGKAQVLLGTMLRVNPILGIRDGETYPVGRERNREKAVEWLYHFVEEFNSIHSLAVEYTTTPDEAEEFAQQLDSIFPREQIYISRVGSAVGAHVGPNILAVTVMEEGGN